MCFLAEKLLSIAGLHYDDIKEIWVVPVHLPLVVTVESDESGQYIMDALVEVHDVLHAAGCTYNNVSTNGGYVSVVGITRVQVAAAA